MKKIIKIIQKIKILKKKIILKITKILKIIIQKKITLDLNPSPLKGFFLGIKLQQMKDIMF